MNDNKLDGVTSDLHIYKLTKAKLSLAWNIAAWLLLLGTLMLVLHKDGLRWLAALFILSLLLFGATIPISLRSIADIEMDGTSISRRFLGRLLQQLPWEDVESIWIFDMYDREQRRQRIAVHIRPKAKMPAHFPFMGQKIVLGDRPMSQGRFIDLVSQLNQYITLHNIKIESTVGGLTSHPSQLSTDISTHR